MSYIVPKKMPLRCFECEYISPSTMDGYSCKTAHKSLVSEHGINIRRPDWCPLIEIKTPHGRLGDLDALVKTLEQNRLCYVSDIDDESFELGTNRAIDVVRNTNTIIEAERSEE